MATAIKISTERLANQFVGYLCKHYGDRRHVRQVAPWIGFLLKAIERVADDGLEMNRTRQIKFKYKGYLFKARYSHDAGTRGGLQIVEYFNGRGAPEGNIAIELTSLNEAEKVYRSLGKKLDAFVE